MEVKQTVNETAEAITLLQFPPTQSFSSILLKLHPTALALVLKSKLDGTNGPCKLRESSYADPRRLL